MNFFLLVPLYYKYLFGIKNITKFQSLFINIFHRSHSLLSTKVKNLLLDIFT